jgi:AcrR family transcriptional regulator
MATLKEQQFQLRQNAIVEAAYHLLVRKGYAATTMDDVAAEVGISKATLYLHFKSKSELALRVIIQQMEAAQGDMQSLDSALPAIERVRRALAAGLRRRAGMGAAQIELLPQDLYGDPAFQAAERRVAEAGVALIKEAQREGDIRTDVPAALLQEFIANVFDMNFERLMQSGISPEQLCEQIIDLVMRAIRS